MDGRETMLHIKIKAVARQQCSHSVAGDPTKARGKVFRVICIRALPLVQAKRPLRCPTLTRIPPFLCAFHARGAPGEQKRLKIFKVDDQGL